MQLMKMHTPERLGGQAARRQVGISLYTLLAAVVVLGVLTAAIVTNFNGSKSKGQAMYSLMHSMGEAANRFNLDTGCYPTSAHALFDETAADDSGNSCGITLNNNVWQGPYINQQQLASGGSAILKPTFGPNTQIDMTSDANDYQVETANLPTAIADKALQSCGGPDASCVVSAGGSGTSTVTYTYSTGG